MAKCKRQSKISKAKADPASRYWRNKADAAWRAEIIRQDGGKCFACEAKENLNAHHLFDRFARKDLRHHLCNGITLCPRHHKWDARCSPHRGPVGFFELLRRERPGVWDWAVANLDRPEVEAIDYRAAYHRLVGDNHDQRAADLGGDSRRGQTDPSREAGGAGEGLPLP